MTSLLIDWSSKKWINLIKINERLGAKALIGFRCFSSCGTVQKINRKTRVCMGKIVFKLTFYVIFKVFQLLPRNVNNKIMYNIEVFTAKLCSKKHLKVTSCRPTWVYIPKRLEEERCLT